ncbi:MAG: glycosyltransferase family 4 protein [Anaerolineales bacterium]
MKIAMLADAYKPHISGITNYIELNKRFLEEAGQEVYIFTFGNEEYHDEETRVIRSPGLPLVDTGYYLSFQYSRKAKELLQDMDILHVHHPFLSGRLALRYARPFNIPIVFTNHTRYDLYAQTYIPGLPEELSTSFLESYMPNFCAAVDMVISPSAGMAQVLRALNVQTDINIVPNGVDLSRFDTPSGDDVRARLGIGAEEIVLIYSGRLAPEKNLNFLLKAFSGVAQALENVHLLMVGEGPEGETLRQQAAASPAAARIHFCGQVSYPEIPSYLRQADCFVTASLSEVHPLSVIEAMAAGLPTLGLRSVGVGDIVRDGETGLLAENDLAAFSAKMTRLCLQRELRQKMSLAARAAAPQYDIRRTSKIMLEHYQRLANVRNIHKNELKYRMRHLIERFRA